MSTIERLDTVEQMAEPWDDLAAAPLTGQGPRVTTAIVPKGSIAGRSLIAVVAIMTFLAALTAGAVTMVASAANDWQSNVSREITIQVRPTPGRDIEADISKAVGIARATSGIADVRVYSKDESEALVEPWLGSGLNLDDLPIPRLIVAKLWTGPPPDFTALRGTLATAVPSASLDDHRRWIDRMRTMAGTAVAGGLAILALVLAVTMLSVSFATRGAMAANRPIIEVLHYVGATDSFIRRQFRRHFLLLGLKGGAIGGGAAMLLFGFASTLSNWLGSTPGGEEFAALFGSFSMSAGGYVIILGQIAAMALVTAIASHRTVRRTLGSIE